MYSRSRLQVLVVLAIISSVLHYGHNILFIPLYHEPESWRLPLLMVWIGMTALAVMGYGMTVRGKEALGIGLLIGYALVGLGTLLHYRSHAFDSFAWYVTLGIWQHVVCTLLLLGYCVGLVWRRRSDLKHGATLV